MARRVLLALVALAGVVVLGLAAYVLTNSAGSLHMGAPPAPVVENEVVSQGSGDSLASSVQSDFEANEAIADSAPQQQVVAGWATKDALAGLLQQSDVLADQNEELGGQAANATSLLATRLDSLISLLTVIALVAISACLLLLTNAVALLWRENKDESPSTRTGASVIEAQVTSG